MNKSQLSGNIMVRVKTIYWIRRAIHSPSLKALLLCAFVGSAASLVSVSNVFANMPSLSDVQATITFMLSAFGNTEISVQALSLLSTAVTLWLLSDLTKTLARVELVYREN